MPSPADTPTATRATPASGAIGPSPSFKRDRLALLALAAALFAVAVVAMSVGRYAVPAVEVVRILGHDLAQILHLDGLIEIGRTWTDQEAVVVSTVRAPRTVLAVMVGGALAVAGAVLQALFRNPLVSPDVIGVSSASSFGGVLAILLGGSGAVLMGGAFAGGLAATGFVMAFGRIRTASPLLTIVLGGIVISAFFNALVSFVTYVADPYETLPAITFWLMGSFTGASWAKVWLAVIPILIGLGVVLTLRWRINVLSLGDEDAAALGVNPSRLRMILITAAALMTAATVASCGVIGWVGLVIPHLVRLVIGPDHRVLLPAAFLMGGTYVATMDTLARTLTAAEVPVGILTAILGAPVFVYVLTRRLPWRRDA